MHSSLLAGPLIVLGVLSGLCFAQDEADPAGLAPADTGQILGGVLGHHGKFELYHAATSVGYSSLGSFGTSSNLLGSAAADYNITTSLAAGYNATGDSGYISLIYTPSYTRRIRFSNLSAFDQALALSLRHSIGRRGAFRFSLDVGDTRTTQQLAFVPSTLANAAGTAGTNSDIVRAILGQSQTNVQLEQVFAQGTSGNAALLALLYGARVFTATAHAEYDWAVSPRSQIFTSINFGRDQPLGTGGETGQLTQSTLRSSAESATAGWNHSLTPKTTMGFAVDYRRSRSAYFNGDVTDGVYTLGREFRKTWFLTASAGLGRVSIIPQTPGTGVRDTLSWLSSTTFGVKGRSQSLIFQAGRSGGDSYGLGSESNTTTGVAWNWTPPRHSWTLSIDDSYQSLETAGKSRTTAWSAGAGAQKRINRQTIASFSFAYLDGSGLTVLSSEPRLSGYQMQLTILWSPRPIL